MGALQHASLSLDPTPKDRFLASLLPRPFARHPARREQGSVRQ